MVQNQQKVLRYSQEPNKKMLWIATKQNYVNRPTTLGGLWANDRWGLFGATVGGAYSEQMMGGAYSEQMMGGAYSDPNGQEMY